MSDSEYILWLMRRREGLPRVINQGWIHLHWSRSKRSWMMRIGEGSLQIVGSSLLELAYRVGNGDFDFIKDYRK